MAICKDLYGFSKACVRSYLRSPEGRINRA